MRLDKFLKVSRLIKRRTVANEACDAGRVMINDKPAKASAAVKQGDIIEIQFGTKSVKVEVLEAIDNQDTENLCEELGDVLYQIMIHCEIEKEQGNFTIDDVVNGICEKMVRRHPRLFGGEMEKDLTWEEIKKREKEARAARKNR